MKLFPIWHVLLLLLAGLLSWSAWGRTITDDSGNTFDVTMPAQRVITLAANLTEIVYAVGGGEHLVGTLDTSNYPAAASKLPRIGDFARLDIERIVQLKPDLILVWQGGNSQRELAQLQGLGIRMFYLDPRRLSDVAVAIEKVALLLGRNQAGERVAQALRMDLQAIRQTHANQRPIRVFYQVWSQPLMTLNDAHLISEVIQLCGGSNVFGRESMLVPQPSVESVVAANPDAILTARAEIDTNPDLHAKREPGHPDLQSWQRFGSMHAVRTGQLYTLPGDVISRAGPRIIDGARAVCTALEQVRKATP